MLETTDPGTRAGTHAVYFFGDGHAEGTRDMKNVLGGKGANLAEMTNLGVPVPPGFTIACASCIDYLRTGAVPEHLRTEVTDALRRLEQATSAIHCSSPCDRERRCPCPA